MPDCVFCGIVEGKIPSFKVFEDDLCIAFLDINPANKGQVILTTKKHVLGIHELSPGDVGKLFSNARLIILAMSQVLGCGGVNIVYALGELAGQRLDHLLVYLIPRFKGDKVVLDWERKQADQAELKATAELLDKGIKAIPVVVSGPPKPKVIELPPDEDKDDAIISKPRVPLY